jgi:class 3 adenylate cyclase/predicted ATPase
MSALPEGPRGKQISASAMFADLVGFATLSRELGTERAYLVVTPCLRILDEVVRKHGGSVDKYSGDKLLGVFGYPLPLEDHAQAAARAALEMRRRVAEYARELGVELELHAGINTGELVAGDIRGPVVREFHVLGDVVNTAARLNAKAPPGSIYVGEATWQATRARLAYQALPPFVLKGKSQPVPAYALLGGDAVEEGRLGQEGSAVPLVGRERELALLREAAAELAAGAGGTVALIGPEGSGKSRLLAELARAPELAGARLLQIQAVQLDRESPGRAAAELASRVLGREVTSFDAVAKALPELLEATARRPHVLALEDAHVLDHDALALIEALLAGLGGRTLLALLTFRDTADEAYARLAGAARRSGARWRELALEPLDERAAEALLDALALETLDAETRRRVGERALGNPGRLLLGAFGSAALRAEQEQETLEERRRHRSRDAERRRVAVLFADISGFTAMTERLGAEKAYPIVAGALERLGEVARRHGGTVDHYLGDCVMALFGVPEAIEDAPRAAVNAAIEMRERIERYNDELGLETRLSVHSGIATGHGIAGDISGPLIREYAVMGEHVDRADELTHVAERGEIYVDAETHRFTADVFEFAEGRALRLRDDAEPAPCFEVRSRQTRVHRAQLGRERRVFSELVGRERELEALRGALAALHAGRGGIVHLVAEAGVGKSRLVTELANDDAARGVAWLLGRSLSTGRNLAYHPFSDLLRSWAGGSDEESEAQEGARIAEAVTALAPELAPEILPFLLRMRGLPLTAGDERRLAEMPGDALERMTRRAVGEVLRHEARRRPLLVVMDDLHWADQSSIELLETLLRLVEEERLLFLIAARPGWADSAARIRQRAREEHAERNLELALEPLGAEAVRRMVRNLFRGGDVPYATRTLIEERARGNPFYIEEVVRALVDQGAVEYRDGAFHATRGLESAEIPGTLQEVVMARVDRLAPERKALLQSAAVVGGTFHTAVLEEMGVAPGRLPELLGELCDAEFLVPSDRFRGEEHSFKHPLIQEVTYDSLLQERREQLHLAVGEAIEKRLLGAAAGVDAMLAYHFGHGGAPERAEEYLFRAGDEAARAAASSEALHFFQEASELYLRLHGEGGDPRKKSLLEKNVGLALFNRGREPEAVPYFDRALGHLGVPAAKSALAAQLRFARDLLSVLPRLYLPAGRGLRAADEGEREVIEIMFQRALAQTTADPTRFLFDSMATLRRIVRLDARSIPSAGRNYAGSVGIFSYTGVSFGIGRRFLALAEPLLEGRPDAPGWLYYRAMRFIHHFLAGDWSAAHEVPLEEVDAQVRAGRLWEAVAYLGLLADKRARCGDFDGFQAVLRRLTEIADGLGYQDAQLAALGDQVYLLLEQGRFDEAAAAADHYREESPQALLHVLALGARAEAQVRAGALADAQATLERAEGVLAAMGSGPPIPYHVSFLHTAHYLFDVAALEGSGAPPARLRRSRREALGSAAKVAARRPQVYRLAGREAWLRGRRKAALRWWGRSLAEAKRLGTRPELARTLHELAIRLAPEARGPDGRTGAECRAAAGALYRELHLDRDLAQLAKSAPS